MHFQAQHLLAAYEIEARWCVGFIGDSRTVATVGQRHEAGGEPFVADALSCTPRRTHSPHSARSRHHSPHHDRISRSAMDLVKQ
jgi:hypothetical protein